MEAGGHEDDVAIRGCQRFVQRPVGRVDALEGEALGLCEAVEVDLLETRLGRRVFGVVLVRRIARPVATRREHLERDQATGLGGGRKEMVDPARGLAAATRLHDDLVRRHEGGAVDRSTRRAGDRDESVGRRSEPDRLTGADQNDRRRRPVEHGLARADNAEIEIPRLDGRAALEHQHQALGSSATRDTCCPGVSR